MSEPAHKYVEAHSDLKELAQRLEQTVDLILEENVELEPETAALAVEVLATAAKLYGGLARGPGNDNLPLHVPAATTDAATAAAALIVSQNLSLFEFNVWYSRVAQAAQIKRDGVNSHEH